MANLFNNLKLIIGRRKLKKILTERYPEGRYKIVPICPELPVSGAVYEISPDDSIEQLIILNEKALMSLDILDFLVLHAIGISLNDDKDTSEFTYANADKINQEHTDTNYYDEKLEFAADDYVIKTMGLKKAYRLIKRYLSKYGRCFYETEVFLKAEADLEYQRLKDRVERMQKLCEG